MVFHGFFYNIQYHMYALKKLKKIIKILVLSQLKHLASIHLGTPRNVKGRMFRLFTLHTEPNNCSLPVQNDYFGHTCFPAISAMNETRKRSRKKTIWMTEDETLNLISVIREHRCLWDRTYRINNQQPSRDEAWETVSQTVGCSAYDLMEKWRSLQSSYRKCKMRCRTVGPDSVTWVYFPAMKFLDGPNDDEEQSSINPRKMRVVCKGPNNINPVRKLKLKMRRNLFPNSVTQRQPMQDNPPTALNQPEPPVDGVVKNEPAMDSPSPPAPPPDFAAAHNEVERLEECSARPSEPKQIPRNQTHHSISIQPHAVGEQDEDFFYVQGVAYLLKQFPAPVKRKLQIEIHDLIVKAQKRQYEQQFGDSFD